MKILFLTTETAHHVFAVKRVAERYPDVSIIVETSSTKPEFETFHPFEEERRLWEEEVLLAGRKITCSDYGKTLRFPSANDSAAVAAIRSLAPDVSIVFGTGRLLAPVFTAASIATVNLHGGNPEKYRGLDTLLWAVYHEDYRHLVATLHHVDEGLDTGEIIGEFPVQLRRETRLPELRSMVTKGGVDILLAALDSFAATGHVAARKQRSRGRYYSFMPAVLKEVCVRKFARHVGSL